AVGRDQRRGPEPPAARRRRTPGQQLEVAPDSGWSRRDRGSIDRDRVEVVVDLERPEARVADVRQTERRRKAAVPAHEASDAVGRWRPWFGAGVGRRSRGGEQLGRHGRLQSGSGWGPETRRPFLCGRGNWAALISKARRPGM